MGPTYYIAFSNHSFKANYIYLTGCSNTLSHAVNLKVLRERSILCT